MIIRYLCDYNDEDDVDFHIEPYGYEEEDQHYFRSNTGTDDDDENVPLYFDDYDITTNDENDEPI